MKIELFLQTELIRAQVPLRSFFHCTVMSWRSTSRPWNWHQHQHSAPHTPPRATYQHPDSQYRHEPPSPQGTKQFNRDIPANFQPDANHFDTKQQYGLSFPRQVTSTAWSQKYHLAGRPIDSVRLYELAYLGWSNWSLRALANGKFTSLVFARSIKESIFFHHLSMKLRDEHMDLDDIAAAYCQQQGIAITDPDPNQLKKAKIHHLVNSTADHFRQFSNTSLQEAQDKIRQLEAQLAATQTISQVPTDEEQAASPQPHPPTTPDEAPPSPTPARK